MEKKVILVTGGSGLVGKGIFSYPHNLFLIILSGSGSDTFAGCDPYHSYERHI
jgi:hypothetical protein